MPRTGPLVKDPTTVALGLAQIRIGLASTFIGQRAPILAEAASVGGLADTKVVGNVDFFKLESGFPLQEDAIFPLREAISLELSFKEVTPANVALARGLNPADYPNVHTGEISFGTMATPVFLRLEAIYTYPDGVNTMKIVFPKMQVAASLEMDFQMEDVLAVPIVCESKRADGAISGGHIIWNGSPLGYVRWDAGTQTTTSSSSTTTTTTAP